MRYGKDHKQATRRRILEAAGRRFPRKDALTVRVETALKLLDDRA